MDPIEKKLMIAENIIQSNASHLSECLGKLKAYNEMEHSNIKEGSFDYVKIPKNRYNEIIKAVDHCSNQSINLYGKYIDIYKERFEQLKQTQS